MSIFFCASHGHQEDSDYVGCVDLGDGRAVCNERAPEAQYEGSTTVVTINQAPSAESAPSHQRAAEDGR
jgi:hypothetical protein